MLQIRLADGHRRAGGRDNDKQDAVNTRTNDFRMVQERNQENDAENNHGDALKDTQHAGLQTIVELRIIGIRHQQHADQEPDKISKAA